MARLDEMTESKLPHSRLDHVLPPSKRYSFHRALRDASFFTAINPEDQTLRSKRFRLWKRFQIVFMFTLCLRLLVECFLPKGSTYFIFLGDFKIWWGKLRETYTFESQLQCAIFFNYR